MFLQNIQEKGPRMVLPQTADGRAGFSIFEKFQEGVSMAVFLTCNPAKKRKSKSSPRKRAARGKQQNPAPLGVLLSMANRAKKRTAAQKAATRRMRAAHKRNPAPRAHARRRSVARHNPHHTRRRRNPVGVGGFGLKSIAEISGGAIAGAFITRKGTELILGPKANEGATGLAGNIVLAFVSGIAVAKIAKQPLIGLGITVGGIVSTYDRWHMEHTLGRAAALFVSGGQSTGKGAALGDMEYNDWGSEALSGYIAAEYSPELKYGGSLGRPVAISRPKEVFVA
jgi:hypothetical protein